MRNDLPRLIRAGREIFFHACSGPRFRILVRVYVKVSVWVRFRNILDRNKRGKKFLGLAMPENGHIIILIQHNPSFMTNSAAGSVPEVLKPRLFMTAIIIIDSKFITY